MWGGISHYRKKWTKSITCSDSRVFQEAGMGCWEGGRLGRSGAPQAQVRVGCGVYPHGQWGAGICWHVGEVSRRAPQAVTENKQIHLSLSLADQLEFPPLCPVSSQALEPRPTSNIPVNPQPGQSPTNQVPPLQCPSLLLPPPHLLPTRPPPAPPPLHPPSCRAQDTAPLLPGPPASLGTRPLLSKRTSHKDGKVSDLLGPTQPPPAAPCGYWAQNM